MCCLAQQLASRICGYLIYFDIYTIHPFSMRDKKNKIESIEFVILLMIYLLYLFICYDAF